jgi:hypothetical protein
MTNSQDRLYAMSQEYGVKTYTIPQANGQYRFVMGGGAVLNDGGWFDSDVPTAAERRGMTKAQIDGIAGYQKAADALYEIVDQVWGTTYSRKHAAGLEGLPTSVMRCDTLRGLHATHKLTNCLPPSPWPF